MAEGHIMISIHYNTHCLDCGVVQGEMVRIGVLVMCEQCAKDHFGLELKPIKLGTIRHEVYQEWLKTYKSQG